MKLSKLIKQLKEVAKANGTFDPEMAFIGMDETFQVDEVGTRYDYCTLSGDVIGKNCDGCCLPEPECDCGS